jgi:hypothetical protein
MISRMAIFVYARHPSSPMASYQEFNSLSVYPKRKSGGEPASSSLSESRSLGNTTNVKRQDVVTRTAILEHVFVALSKRDIIVMLKMVQQDE